MLRKLVLIFICSLFATAVQAKTEKITLLLDWYINPNHAPIMVAQEHGFFKQQGLSVRIIQPSDPADPIKLVAANQADIGVTYQPAFTVAVSQGLPLVRIGTLIDQPLNCLMVLQNGPIHQLTDLKGKAIGYSDADNHVMLRTMLNHVGLNIAQVDLINLHFNETQALMAHQVSAVTGAMRNIEPIEMALAGQPARVFYPENYGMPSYDELIFVANKHNIDARKFKKFLLALQQANAYLQTHSEDSWQAFATANPALNNELNRRAWTMTLPYFAKNPAMLDAEKYSRYTAFLEQAGLVKNMPPVSTYAVDILQGN